MRKLVLASCLCVAAAAIASPPDDTLRAGEGPKPVLDSYADALARYARRSPPKIVGGQLAPIGAFPWQVSLNIASISDPYWAHFCGGAVYSERWILTAAHCVNADPEEITVVAGTNELVEGARRIAVRRIHVAPAYNDQTVDNDLALLELAEPLVLGERVKPIPIVDATREAGILNPGAPLTVTGWGASSPGGDQELDLRFLDVPFVERVECNRPLAYDGRITPNMLCAGDSIGGKDSCDGDSGGPLSTRPGPDALLVGIVSWGDGCGVPNRVGVYTRVSRHSAWIRACTSNATSCR